MEVSLRKAGRERPVVVLLALARVDPPGKEEEERLASRGRGEIPPRMGVVTIIAWRKAII